MAADVDFSRIIRGQIYLADLDTPTGSEIGKSRPVIIVQNDADNKEFSTVIVVPLTSSPWYDSESHVLLQKKYGLDQNSTALCEQIKTLDKNRLIHFITKIPESKMKEIDRALAVSINIASETTVAAPVTSSFDDTIINKINEFEEELASLESKKIQIQIQIDMLNDVLNMNIGDTPVEPASMAPAKSAVSKITFDDYLEMFEMVFAENGNRGITNKEMTGHVSILMDKEVREGSVWNALNKAVKAGKIIKKSDLYSWV